LAVVTTMALAGCGSASSGPGEWSASAPAASSTAASASTVVSSVEPGAAGLRVMGTHDGKAFDITFEADTAPAPGSKVHYQLDKCAKIRSLILKDWNDNNYDLFTQDVDWYFNEGCG
jgi:hypothetical protein